MPKDGLKIGQKKVRPDRVLTPYERVKRSRYKKAYSTRIDELENALLQDFTVSVPSKEQIELIRKLYPLFLLSPFCNQLAFKYDSKVEKGGIKIPSIFTMILQGKKPSVDSLATHKKQVRSKNYGNKRCYRCKIYKNMNEFYNNKARYDGKQNICKKCLKKG